MLVKEAVFMHYCILPKLQRFKVCMHMRKLTYFAVWKPASHIAMQVESGDHTGSCEMCSWLVGSIHTVNNTSFVHDIL